MKRRSISLSAIFVLLLFSTTLLAAGKIWVASTGAKLKTENKATSRTIEYLSIGDELSVLNSSGRWYEVKTGSGEQGWIYRGKVSREPPSTTESGGSLVGTLPGSSIQANASDTSRSVRGLSPAAEEYANNTKTPVEYKKALDKVLEVRVTDSEIEEFLREGGVGEYAR
jgi:hypothetical protein